MNDLILIPHKEITEKQIEEIINIKTEAWPYSFEKQLEWINANIKPTDIHVVLSQNKKNFAYLNLIDIDIKIDGALLQAYGIGNVCATEKGKGWGKEIIAQTNQYLKTCHKTGLLFCKNNLIDFYSSNKWQLAINQKLKLAFNNESIATMHFNINTDYQYLEYSGKQF